MCIVYIPSMLAESDGDSISMYYTLFDTGYTQLDIKYTKIYTTSVARTIASFFSDLLSNWFFIQHTCTSIWETLLREKRLLYLFTIIYIKENLKQRVKSAWPGPSAFYFLMFKHVVFNKSLKFCSIPLFLLTCLATLHVHVQTASSIPVEPGLEKVLSTPCCTRRLLQR